MAIKMTVPPVGEPLSLARIKTQLRLDTDYSDEDDYLSELIQAARERAEALTSRACLTQKIREYRHSFPGHHHPLPLHLVEHDHRHTHWELSRSPVQSIASIGYIDSSGTTQTLPTGTYNADLILEPASIHLAPHACWPIAQYGQPNTVWVEYVAGYSDDDSEVPASLKAAMALLVAHWYDNREPVQATGIAEVPMTVRDLLNLNRVYYQP